MKSSFFDHTIKTSGFLSKFIVSVSFLFMFFFGYETIWSQTSVAANGQLKVEGNQLANENGEPVQLRGMSTHGLQWYGYCINYSAIQALVNDWGADVLRLAMYPDESGSGWVYDQEYYNALIDDFVKLTEQFGIYCIIDWHVHLPGDPMTKINEARVFWELMSSRYAEKEHVIYEICNEPNGVNWSRIKEYADQVIPIIRANDPDQVILVGTPTYSQDVDLASQNPLKYDNLLYSLHFYAGTHGVSLREKANTALTNGIGLFITEWGTSNADGDGGPFPNQADEWLRWVNENKLSWCNWSFSDKSEVSAALVNGSCFGKDWNNTSASGTYVKKNMLNPPDSWADSTINIPPTATITSPVAQSKFKIGEKITIEASASDKDGSVSFVEFYASETKIGESTTVPYIIQFAANTMGTVELFAVVTDNDGATNNSNIVRIDILEEINQKAYPNGIPHTVPGKINATHYDLGGEGIAYHDADAINKGGFNRTDEGVDTESSENGNIGYIVNGEWVEYTVNVANPGTYTFEIKIASQPGGGQFHLEFDSVKTEIQNVTATGGWTSYTTYTIQDIGLAAGEQVMRLFADVGDFNFATMNFTFTGTIVPPTGVIVSPTEITLEVGSSSYLKETILPAEATNKNVKWTTSNNSVATVNSDGLVSAVGEGSATITVTTQEGNHTATCIVAVNQKPVGPYTLTISYTGQGGAVEVNPDQELYNDGTQVTLTALQPDNGYEFIGWSGDTSGTDLVLIIIMDSDKAIIANYAPIRECETISMSFEKNGAGDLCFIAKGTVNKINSWNMDYLEVNGKDFTNVYAVGSRIPASSDGLIHIAYRASVDWAHFEIDGEDGNGQNVRVTGEDYLNLFSSSFPTKRDGGYYIHNIASHGWPHFEAARTKSIEGMDSFVDVQVFPNPFERSTRLFINNYASVNNILIVDQIGRIVLSYSKNELSPFIHVGENLASGLYYVKVITETNNQTIILNKK